MFATRNRIRRRRRSRRRRRDPFPNTNYRRRDAITFSFEAKNSASLTQYLLFAFDATSAQISNEIIFGRSNPLRHCPFSFSVSVSVVAIFEGKKGIADSYSTMGAAHNQTITTMNESRTH